MEVLRGERKVGLGLMAVGLVVIMSQIQGSLGIRFVIEKEECLSHNVQYEGDTLHFSFVVIKSDATWSYGNEGVDLVVRAFLYNSLSSRYTHLKWFSCFILVNSQGF